MIKSTLLQQREERDALLGRGYIDRLDVPAKSEYLESSLIKLITGPRRSGKSVLALQLLHGEYITVNVPLIALTNVPLSQAVN